MSHHEPITQAHDDPQKKENSTLSSHHYESIQPILQHLNPNNHGVRVYIGKINPLPSFPPRYHTKANELIGRFKLYDVGGIGDWRSFVVGNRIANVMIDSVETVVGNKTIFANNNIMGTAKTTINLNAGKDLLPNQAP